MLQVSCNSTAAAATLGNIGDDASGNGWAVAVSDCAATNKLLLLFQRLLVGHLYSHSTSFSPLTTPSSPASSLHVPTSTSLPEHNLNQHIEATIAVLVKYVSMLHHHMVVVLPEATALVLHQPQLLRAYSQVLQTGPAEVLLPELSVSLVLLQLHLPMKMVENKCLESISDLMEVLDKFNRLFPGAAFEESADMSWPDARSELGAWVKWKEIP